MAQFTNQAFVFIKPHAVTDSVKQLCEQGLQDAGLTILSQGSISSEQIDQDKLIDQHYYAIASKATILTPDQLNIPKDKFKQQFGKNWDDVLKVPCGDEGSVMNALKACELYGLSADDLDKKWAKCKKDGKMIKFGGGFYCGLVENIDGQGKNIYTFNGFFMSMRSKFTAPGQSIYYYVVEWVPSSVSWEQFRGTVLGPTDPVDAPASSLRGMIYKNWKKLGLKAEPNVGDNGVHASASPFEALAEFNNWLGKDVDDCHFGQMMLSAGIGEDTIFKWSVDPQVNYDVSGKKGSLFDSVEDQNAYDCLNKLCELFQHNKPPPPTVGSMVAGALFVAFAMFPFK